MAVLMEKALFYHIPKTAGSWIRLALTTASVPWEELPCKHCGPNPVQKWGCCGHASYDEALHPDDGINRFRFTFIRHPLKIYQSYWAYKMRENWTPRNPFDETVYSTRFDEFVNLVIRKHPGLVTKWFSKYVGPEHEPYMQFVGRQERLIDDLVHALTTAGQPFHEAALRSTEPNNVAAGMPEWKEHCRYTPALRDAVLEAEAGAIERFYAHEPIPEGF